MVDTMSRLSCPTIPRSLAIQDRASPDPLAIVVVAGDRFALRGMALMLDGSGSVSTVEAHDSIDTAMSGPLADLVVMHTGTPGLTSAKVMELVQRRQAVALLAAGPDGPDGLIALRAAGARGLFSGTESSEVCAGMLQLAMAGGSCWPAALAISQDTGDRPHRMLDDCIRLTARQWEIAAELVHGRSNKQIAHAVGITEGTAKIHITSIFRALGVRNRAMAIVRLIPLLDARIGDASVAPAA